MQTRPIAPCGMNCATCLAFLRDKNTCPGCWGEIESLRPSCSRCSIRNCEHLAGTESKFCYECAKFPCQRIKHIDKRYRTRYRVSFIENLFQIKNNGLEKFIESEREKWRCPGCGGTICVHRGICLDCNKATSLKTSKRRKAEHENVKNA